MSVSAAAQRVTSAPLPCGRVLRGGARGAQRGDERGLAAHLQPEYGDVNMNSRLTTNNVR
jgi:hypothetical protein